MTGCGDVMVKAAVRNEMFVHEEGMVWRNVRGKEILRCGWRLCGNVMRVCGCRGGAAMIWGRGL